MDIRTGVYSHYKNGNKYKVIGVAHHSEYDELFVVYQAEYGEKKMWVRPYDMFIEWVERQGSLVPRFTFNNS